MHTASFPQAVSPRRRRRSGRFPPSIFLHPRYTERGAPDRPVTGRALPRQISIPGPGVSLDFNEVLNLVSVGVLYHQHVAVLCLTEDILRAWALRLTELPEPMPGLDVIDVLHAGHLDWVCFFDDMPHDVTILHGAYAALDSHSISLGDVMKLVDAVPAGLLVLA